jgi:DNA replication protein DnaC
VGDVLRTIRSSFDQKNVTEEETIRQFTAPRVLVLDDLGKERPTEWAVEQLFSIINTRYDAKRPIIVTTNYGGQDLVQRLTPRGERDDTTPRAIVDRLREMSSVIKLEGESMR